MKPARTAADNGELLLAGAFADPVDGTAFVFKAADQSVAERFAANDPYVAAELVTKWTLRKGDRHGRRRTLGNIGAYFKRPAARTRPELDVLHTPLTGYLRSGQQSLFGDMRELQSIGYEMSVTFCYRHYCPSIAAYRRGNGIDVVSGWKRRLLVLSQVRESVM